MGTFPNRRSDSPARRHNDPGRCDNRFGRARVPRLWSLAEGQATCVRDGIAANGEIQRNRDPLEVALSQVDKYACHIRNGERQDDSRREHTRKPMGYGRGARHF